MAAIDPGVVPNVDSFLSQHATMGGACVEVQASSALLSSPSTQSVLFVGVWDGVYGRMNLYAQLKQQVRVGASKSSSVVKQITLTRECCSVHRPRHPGPSHTGGAPP